MNTTNLKIEGLNCLSCVEQVEEALEAVPGVKMADAQLDGITLVEHDNVDENKLLQAVAGAGDFKAHVVRETVAQPV